LEAHEIYGYSTSSMFQFHFGSIGSLKLRTELLLMVGVSIPLWFDWKNKKQLNILIITVVSIPLWFDWKKGRFSKKVFV